MRLSSHGKYTSNKVRQARKASVGTEPLLSLQHLAYFFLLKRAFVWALTQNLSRYKKDSKQCVKTLRGTQRRRVLV